MKGPGILTRNGGIETEVGLRGTYARAGKRVCAQITLWRDLAFKEPLGRGTHHGAQLRSRYCSHPAPYTGVQSCSSFRPDGLASPLTPHCQAAFCSLAPVPPDGNSCEPTDDPNPLSSAAAISHLPILFFFFYIY